MAYGDPNAPRSQPVSTTTIAIVVYALYPRLPCHGRDHGDRRRNHRQVQCGSADPLMHSHYRFEIRTFWIGLFYFVIGVVLCFVVVGAFVLLWWFTSSLVRNIKGLLALNEGRPVANPTSWMFG